MATATHLPDTDMSNWQPGVRHYAISDGTFLAVEVDEGLTPEMTAAIQEVTGRALLTHKPRPTTIVAVDTDGNAASLDRLHEFPPGTTHEQALELAGYGVVTNAARVYTG